MIDVQDIVNEACKDAAKKFEDDVVFEIKLKYDTQATAQSIIERLKRADELEKEYAKLKDAHYVACRALEFYFADETSERYFWDNKQWERWCRGDE